ncbi:MAG: hypothetical protein IPH07_13585 [Deltaproteobacteria bacterium]|nr:hypothetical protein [Deltaproteobacteria bacterium]MBK8241189.1 hypothetical protein [Deltaproteobacteria bacterium]MBK8716889.1 hypothetical protein [Deltaproteobacteria bacterium]MBP7286993.1 hypothetical protein [Nannocystaceae bacterium]
MASLLKAQPIGRGFHGLNAIYQFVNADGAVPSTACGQAAVATFLVQAGLLPAELTSLRKVERSHPADLGAGYLGTTPSRVRKALEAYGAKPLQIVESVADVQRRLAGGFPVVCLVQNPGGRLGLPTNGAHWFVLYAYDDDGIFATNSAGKYGWSEFEGMFSSLTTDLAWLTGFNAICATSRPARDAVRNPNIT